MVQFVWQFEENGLYHNKLIMRAIRSFATGESMTEGVGMMRPLISQSTTNQFPDLVSHIDRAA
jgi:hypothetical protein